MFPPSWPVSWLYLFITSWPWMQQISASSFQEIFLVGGTLTEYIVNALSLVPRLMIGTTSLRINESSSSVFTPTGEISTRGNHEKRFHITRLHDSSRVIPQ